MDLSLHDDEFGKQVRLIHPSSNRTNQSLWSRWLGTTLRLEERERRERRTDDCRGAVDLALWTWSHGGGADTKIVMTCFRGSRSAGADATYFHAELPAKWKERGYERPPAA